MKPSLTNRLAYLHTRLAADFGDTEAQTVWLQAGDTWTSIPVLQLRVRPAEGAGMGLPRLPTDSLVLYVKKADWPAAALNNTFLLGPAAAGNAAAPDATNQKYIITAVPTLPQLDWLRIEAEAH